MTKSEKVEACDSTESISTTQVSWKDTPTTSASLEINALILLKDWWRKCLIDSGTLIEVGGAREDLQQKWDSLGERSIQYSVIAAFRGTP